jgi:hypothetical protein
MVHKKPEKKRVDESLYRYLLTIARRNGFGNVRVRVLARSGKSVCLVKNNAGGVVHHFLPSSDLSTESEESGMDGAIRDAVEKTGADVSCIRRYIGGKVYSSSGTRTRCFDFEVIVKGIRKGKNIRWVRKHNIKKLNIPKEEKRVLKHYFVGQ